MQSGIKREISLTHTQEEKKKRSKFKLHAKWNQEKDPQKKKLLAYDNVGFIINC